MSPAISQNTFRWESRRLRHAEPIVRRGISLLILLASLFYLTRTEASLPKHNSNANRLSSATLTIAGSVNSLAQSVTVNSVGAELYDLNGNLTSDGRLGYAYDDSDQLTRITATNEWKSEFGYDALAEEMSAANSRGTRDSELGT
jgi:YD repeat-containing protein